MVNRLGDHVAVGSERSIADLNSGHATGRQLADLLGPDARSPEVPAVEGETPVWGAGGGDKGDRLVQGGDVGVKARSHELKGEYGGGMSRSLDTEFAERLGEAAQFTTRADANDLDVVNVEGGGGLEYDGWPAVGFDAKRVIGVEEEVHDRVELQLAEPRGPRDVADLPYRVRLEQMFQVRVPDARPGESRAGRALTPLSPAERAPFLAL